MLAGGSDGLHWGYCLDDPDAGSGRLRRQLLRRATAFDLEADGDDLFEAVRLHLEYLHADAETYRDEDPESADEYGRRLQRLAELARAAGGCSPVVSGWAMSTCRRSPVTCSRAARVVARTRTGLGIVAPPEVYRPLSRADKQLWTYLRKTKNPCAVVEERGRRLREATPRRRRSWARICGPMGGPGRLRGGAARRGVRGARARDAAAVLQTHVANRRCRRWTYWSRRRREGRRQTLLSRSLR